MELENGTPSHNTIGRFTIGRFTIEQFFGLLDPEAFEARFSRWVHEACEHVDGEVVTIDGKTLRRSYDRDSSKAAVHMISHMISHMVSAWARENGMTLGQVKTEEKSNEIEVQ